MTTTMTYKCRK